MSNAARQRNQVNFEMVADAVASYYGISVDLLFTKTRKREVNDARQVVMYLAKKLAKLPMTVIGQRLDRSHATVIHGCRVVEDRMASKKKFAGEIPTLSRLP